MNHNAQTLPWTDSIRRAVETGRIALPPLPNLVNHLMEILKREDTSSRDVAKLVGTDPAVAATVLRWANSPVFGGLTPVTDLSLAIARLGFKQVTSAVTTVAHSAHFHSDDPSKAEILETLWSHAVVVGWATKQIATLTGGDPEESFVAGLLHDTGKLLVLRTADYLEEHDKAEITPVVLHELMDTLHTELGYKTLTSWRVPQPVCEAALHHHDEEPDQEHPLAIQVQAADAIACKIGFHIHPDPDLNLTVLPALEYLNLSDLELATVMVDVEDQVAEIKSLF
jgi:HD-like signal output (HDOD) protein